MLMTKSEQQHLWDITNPQVAWTKLQGVYEAQTPARRALFKQMLKNTQLSDDGDVRKYVNKIDTIAQDIIGAGRTMDNIDIADAILEGLPESYSTVKVYLNMLQADKDALVHSLLSEEQLRKKEKGTEGTVTVLTANVKPGWKTQKSFT